MAAATQQHHPSTLLPSSIFSTPSFTSTLPLRPNSASGANWRSSANRKGRLGSRQTSAQQRRRTRSVTSDMDDGESENGSLGDFSMENYTIDLAELARGGSGKIGVAEAENSDVEQEEGEDADEDNKDQTEDGRVRGERGDSKYDENPRDDEEDFMGGYEVDLGGMGDKPSSVAVEDRWEERDEVASEADGPEDFTVNMGAWMKGTAKLAKHQDRPVMEDEEPDPDTRHESTLGIDTMDASIMEPLSTSTPASREHRNEVEAPETHRGDQRPLFPRREIELLQNQAAEEVLQRISVLQEEVEKMRKEEHSRRLAYERLEEQNRKLKNGNIDVEAFKTSSHQLTKGNAGMDQQIQERQSKFAATASPMASSATGISQTAADELAAVRAEAERTEMASNEKIEILEAGLQASHSTIRILREEIAEDEKMHKTKVEGLREDLERLRAEVDTKNGQIADMEQDAETHTEIIKHRDELIARLTTDAQIARTELGYAQQEARESRRIAGSVEEENDRLTSQTAQQAEEVAALETSLKEKATALQAAYTSIAQVPDTPHDFIPVDVAAHEAALSSLKQQHDVSLATLNKKFAQQLQLFKRERDAQTLKHRTELEEMKKAPQLNANTETELRSAIRALSSKLEKANAATRAARAEVEHAQEDVEAARRDAEAQRTDNELVNADLEDRFAGMVEAREREWRRRVAVLFRERETMGKALMAGWGREDVGKDVKGEDGGQGYRYRFVRRG